MNRTNWNEEKIAQLINQLPELEIAEQKLKEAIEFVTKREKKQGHHLAEKQAIQLKHHENRIEK